ncbi:hypothetical protein MSAN_02448300 [Mycena sanguinolenta]|uniref:Uncharacterized protein n=1 Tax=Mycena sanguinolenta TaxID=230812 RepID=A0A8H7CC33_9AGAR|nr:hypothetical protein MSAN_02448300 [Mycena sanguinolenta]
MDALKGSSELRPWTLLDTRKLVLEGTKKPCRRTWSCATMSEFRGSCAANPWVLNAQGELVLLGAKYAGPKPYSGGSPSSIDSYRPPPRQSSEGSGPPPAEVPAEGSRILRALNGVDTQLASGRIKTSTSIRAAREAGSATPCDQRRSRLDKNSRVITWFRSPSTSSAATRLVHRTPAERARQLGSWEL